MAKINILTAFGQEKGKEGTFISFYTQREAKYKNAPDSVFNNKKIPQEKVGMQSYLGLMDIPSPTIKEIDGYKSDKEVNPEHDYSQDYLTFKALEAGTFTLTIGSAVTTTLLSSVSYSLDNGDTWTTTNNVDSQTVTITTPSVEKGQKVLWKGSGTAMSITTSDTTAANRAASSSIFSSSGEFEVYGNIMSLLYDDNFTGITSMTGVSNFALLFYSYNMVTSAKVVSSKNLVLPATAATNYCYLRLFQGTQLVNSPTILPATTLATGCYFSMFNGCTSLATAPELPATTLAENCYTGMFRDCTGLATAPKLSTTTLASNCYREMFYGCASLTTAPELPATTLADSCYFWMFRNCTSLTTAPALPATTLAQSCYANMFYGCTSLTTAPELPATTLADSCYHGMFRNCTSLTTAPELPTTTLTNNCYTNMFYDCISLTTAPELPATTLTNYCYSSMFQGCTSLTTAPELPATTLVSSCYSSMFRGCTKLNYIKAMFTTTPSTTYTENWVLGVSFTGTFVKNSAATWNVRGNYGVPTSWTVQTTDV